MKMFENEKFITKGVAERKHKAASYKAKQEYLLSGKIRCGDCGSNYCGNARKASDKNPLYISYNCVKKNGSVKCRNPGVKRDVIEQLVLDRLSTMVFSKGVLPTILAKYNEYALSRNAEYLTITKGLQQRLADTEKGIENIVGVVVSTGSAALADKLKELEMTKQQLTQAIIDAEQQMSKLTVDESKLRAAFYKARRMLKSGTLKNRKAIVEKYIRQITIYKDKIEIEYAISDTYSFKEEVDRQ